MRHEDRGAHQEHPGGKRQLEPLLVGGAHQEQHRDQVAEVRDPARQCRGTEPCRADGDREHRGHPHGVDGDESLRGVPSVGPDLRAAVRLLQHQDQAGRDRGPGEEQGQEEQPAAHEDRREQAVLDVSQLLADHPDEPQERDPGEGHELETEPDQLATVTVGEQGLVARVGHRHARQHHGGQEQDPEDDSGDRRCASGAPEGGRQDRTVGAHRATSPSGTGTA